MRAHELQALITKLESAKTFEFLQLAVADAIHELQRQRRFLLSLADLIEQGLNK
jgi:hypothetical protein